jgi:hypothetical protein
MEITTTELLKLIAAQQKLIISTLGVTYSHITSPPTTEQHRHDLALRVSQLIDRASAVDTEFAETLSQAN